MITDTFQHKGLRRRLVEEIKRKGISDEAVLEAIGKVPRHVFMESSFSHFAYKDNAFPIAAGQTISQPYTVAFQSQLLRISVGDKVLEIGTGSGYQTCVLVELKANVYTIERIRELFNKTQVLLTEMGYKANFFYGDGYKGLPSYGPFDKILITAGIPAITDDLLRQLKIGGLLVAPVGNSQNQVMTAVARLSTDEFKTTKFGDFIFVPMLPGVEK